MKQIIDAIALAGTGLLQWMLSARTQAATRLGRPASAGPEAPRRALPTR
ncbi:MAG: hypothetical protein JNK87_41410 [Bryobacterales bacterium]|nr:hypothetical protein [Bryobacterales bacterium]